MKMSTPWSRILGLLLACQILSLASSAPLKELSRKSVNGSLSVTLRVTTGRVDAGDFSFNTRLFNGLNPGPIIIISAGDRLRVLIKNELGANPGAGVHNDFRQPNTTNLHTHGLHVSSQGNQDNVFRKANPGESLQYEYDIHPQHLGGTHWYHPHFHGSTALQVGGGMAGVIIVRDDPATTPAALARLTERVMLLQYVNVAGGNVGETLSQNDEVAGLSGSTLGMSPSGSGAVYLVNGQKNPTVLMQPGEWQRWRLAHASSGVNLDLVISPGCEMQLIATDGVYLTDGVPVAVTSVSLVPGSRRDILVRCASAGTFALSSSIAKVGVLHLFPTATTIVTVQVEGAPVTMEPPTSLPSLPSYMPDLRNVSATGTFVVGFDDGLVTPTWVFIVLPVIFVVLMAIHIALWYTRMLARLPALNCLCRGSVKTKAGKTQPEDPPPQNSRPTPTIEVDDTKAEDPPPQQPQPTSPSRGSILHWLLVPNLLVFGIVITVLLLTTPTDIFMVNGEAFTGETAFQHTMALGSVQEWTVDSDHPFHIHINHFQLISTGCTGDCAFGFRSGNYYDTIMYGGDPPNPPGGNSIIRFKPADYTGKVVMHCHVLAHEDRGMMAVAEIVS